MIRIRKDHTKSGKKSKWFAKNYRGSWMFLENGGQRKKHLWGAAAEPYSRVKEEGAVW